MRFRIDKILFEDAIDSALKIVNERSEGFTSKVILEVNEEESKIYIKASDNSIQFITDLFIENAEGGSISVSCSRILAMIKNTSDILDCKYDETDPHLYIKSNKSYFKLRIYGIGDFPNIEVKKENYFTLEADIFATMIDKTILSVITDESRLNLSGAYFEKEYNDSGSSLIMASSNGKKLSYYRVKKEIDYDFNGILIPLKTLRIIKSLLPKEGLIELSIDENEISFKIRNLYISSLLINADFPDYRRVIPEEFNKELKINKSQLLKALTTISSIKHRFFKAVLAFNRKENIEENEENNCIVTLLSEESEEGTFAQMELNANLKGENLKIAFNHNFAQEAIRVINSQNIIIKLNNEDDAILFTSDIQNEGFQDIQVVMPMNL